MLFDSRIAYAATAGLLVSSIAMADQVFLDFEQEELVGATLTDFYSDQGITFSGLLFDSVDQGDYDPADPVVRNLRGMWGADYDSEAVSSGFGVTSVTIGFEATNGGFEGLSFLVARIMTQDITVLARNAVTGEISSHFFTGSEETQQSGRTVEEFAVDLDSLFGSASAPGVWSEVAIHNHGGFFGVDNISYLAQSVPVPGLAPAMAGLLGLGAMRRRRR